MVPIVRKAVTVVDGNAWLADFEARAAAAKEKADQFRENLNSAGASASSKDGLVTVTVAPNGSLADLRINDAALHGSGARLAAEILRTAREAQRRAAGNVLTAFTELGGTDSEATKMITGFVQPPEPPDPTDAATGSARFLPPEQPQVQPPPVRPQPPAPTYQRPPEPQSPEPSTRQARRTTRPADDDESSGGDSVLGRTDW